MTSFEPYPLTELDHLLMLAYVYLFLTFNTSNTEDNISRLKNGASRLIQEWPFLASTIAKPGQERPHQKAYQVQPPSKSELQANPILHIKFHRVPVSVMKQVEETPEQLIPIKPRSPTPYPAPARRFQANIMTDGIILAASWHHRFMDTFGCHAVFDGLAHFCRGGGSYNFGGMAKSPAAFADAYVSAYATSHYRENQVLRGYVLCFRKIQTPKEMCNSRLAELGQSRQIELTCDDIVTALMWLAAANERNRAFSIPRSSLMRYANARNLLEPCIPSAFFGNAVAVSRSYCNVHELQSATETPNISGCEAIPGLTQEAINALSRVAWLGRSANRSIDASHVGDLLATFRASHDWDSLNIAPADVPVSSIRKIAFYGLDFGQSFGPVKDVDPLEFNLQGQCVIGPARYRGSDTPWEIRMAFPKEVTQHLETDPLLLWARIEEKPKL
ncbi:uncharacterized protein KD926_002000 [Aspergillus affinis]|uniref:uncharacterized protein n=1 Tax=Aspergillus affinis TaxID=1070780 RepID=UPI0022FDCEF7|nr:uncharacterized protein KD926_002000 [Aspergillus affinis]KAI9044176.1 hypothetical protein KD926_002000 [Aspergillus affinis]